MELQRKKWALTGVQAMIKMLLKKRNQTRFNKSLFNLYFWKTQAMKKVNDLNLAGRQRQTQLAEHSLE